MNAGLSNLAILKRHLLPDSQQTDTTFDATITQLGLGVAALMEKHCNRQFTRATAATFEFTGDRYSISLPIYPIESVTTIETRTGISDSYASQTITDILVNRDYAAGLLYFGARLGTAQTMVRVTWAGGYFWEQLEPTDGAYPTSTPSGSTALPKDLQTAWLLQCEALWTARDKLGTSMVDKTAVQFVSTSLFGLELTPFVKAMLNGFIRYQMS